MSRRKIPKAARRKSYLCSWADGSGARRVLARSVGEAAECFYRQTCADDSPEHGSSIGDVHVRDDQGKTHWMVVSSEWVLDIFARPGGKP